MSFQCPKCQGDKNIRMFTHVQHGICFMCDGTGEVDKLPEDHDHGDVCDKILHLIMKKDGQWFSSQFCIWNDDNPSQHAGTGHYGTTNRTDWMNDAHVSSDRHMSLTSLRGAYADAMRQGYTLASEDEFKSMMNELALTEDYHYEMFFQMYNEHPQRNGA